MSLRTCPDCGKDVSSSAPACPHCGRPNRKAPVVLGIAGALVFVVAGVAAIVWWSEPRKEAPGDTTAPAAPATAPETVIARPYRQLEHSLTAAVGYNRTLHLFRIENRDAFPWTGCQLTLNAHGLTGYELEVEAIKPGLTDAALLSSAEFAEASGRKFDPATQQVSTLDLDCETPQGRLYYGGRFGPEDSAALTAGASGDRR